MNEQKQMAQFTFQIERLTEIQEAANARWKATLHEIKMMSLETRTLREKMKNIQNGCEK